MCKHAHLVHMEYNEDSTCTQLPTQKHEEFHAHFTDLLTSASSHTECTLAKETLQKKSHELQLMVEQCKQGSVCSMWLHQSCSLLKNEQELPEVCQFCAVQ